MSGVQDVAQLQVGSTLKWLERHNLFGAMRELERETKSDPCQLVGVDQNQKYGETYSFIRQLILDGEWETLLSVVYTAVSASASTLASFPYMSDAERTQHSQQVEQEGTLFPIVLGVPFAWRRIAFAIRQQMYFETFNLSTASHSSEESDAKVADELIALLRELRSLLYSNPSLDHYRMHANPYSRASLESAGAWNPNANESATSIFADICACLTLGDLTQHSQPGYSKWELKSGRQVVWNTTKRVLDEVAALTDSRKIDMQVAVRASRPIQSNFTSEVPLSDSEESEEDDLHDILGRTDEWGGIQSLAHDEDEDGSDLDAPMDEPTKPGIVDRHDEARRAHDDEGGQATRLPRAHGDQTPKLNIPNVTGIGQIHITDQMAVREESDQSGEEDEGTVVEAPSTEEPIGIKHGDSVDVRSMTESARSDSVITVDVQQTPGEEAACSTLQPASSSRMVAKPGRLEELLSQLGVDYEEIGTAPNCDVETITTARLNEELEEAARDWKVTTSDRSNRSGSRRESDSGYAQAEEASSTTYETPEQREIDSTQPLPSSSQMQHMDSDDPEALQLTVLEADPSENEDPVDGGNNALGLSAELSQSRTDEVLEGLGHHQTSVAPASARGLTCVEANGNQPPTSREADTERVIPSVDLQIHPESQPTPDEVEEKQGEMLQHDEEDESDESEPASPTTKPQPTSYTLCSLDLISDAKGPVRAMAFAPPTYKRLGPNLIPENSEELVFRLRKECAEAKRSGRWLAVGTNTCAVHLCAVPSWKALLASSQDPSAAKDITNLEDTSTFARVVFDFSVKSYQKYHVSSIFSVAAHSLENYPINPAFATTAGTEPPSKTSVLVQEVGNNPTLTLLGSPSSAGLLACSSNHPVIKVSLLKARNSGRLGSVAIPTSSEIRAQALLPSLAEQALLCGHSGTVRSLVWQPRAEPFLYSGGAGDFAIRLWDITRAKFAPPASTVGVPENESVALRGPLTREAEACVRMLSAHSAPVFDMAVCPEAPFLLVSGGQDKRVHLWDIRVGGASALSLKPQATVVAPAPVSSVQLGGAGTRVFCGTSQGHVVAWDLRDTLSESGILPEGWRTMPSQSDTSNTAASYICHQLTTGDIRALNLSPDETRLICGSFDGAILELDAKTGDVVRNYRTALSLGDSDETSPGDRITRTLWHPRYSAWNGFAMSTAGGRISLHWLE